MRNLSAIYDASFFESYNAEQEADIRATADIIYDAIAPDSALDIGCGPGMMVRRFRERGVDAFGIDGSSESLVKAHQDVRPFLSIADVCAGCRETARELVICTEVAEHVPEGGADTLVRVMTDAALRWIVFTAAPPGQGGHDHINEQPMWYWVEKFARRGWVVDGSMTATIKSALQPLTRCWYYGQNIIVLRPA